MHTWHTLFVFFGEKKRWVEEEKYDTVDGRNPAPVDMENIPLFTVIVFFLNWCRISSIKSISQNTANQRGP